MRGPHGVEVANYLAYLAPRCLWCYRLESPQRKLAVCEHCSVASWCAGAECETKGRKAHAGAHCEQCREMARDDEHIW